MSDIIKFQPLGTYIDEDRVEGSEWKYDDGDLLIPVDKINLGASINILQAETKGEGTNATLLSLNHPNLYKDIELTSEIEFTDINKTQDQTLEIITRAISKYDKRFSTDEFYALGYKNGSFYFTKYSYFLENGKTLVYSVLYNLGNDDQIRYFLDFTDGQKEELYIDDKLDYNTKYLIRFSIIGNSISLDIKRRSGVISQSADMPWVNILQNIDISNGERSIRSKSLDKVISVPVTPTNIDNKGFFGINVPNSHLKLYRMEVRPLDSDTNLKLYDDKEYSRNIASEFNFVFKNSSRILLNSITGTSEGDSNVLELHNTDKVILDKRNVSELSKGDIEKVQFNNFDLNTSQYTDRIINITTKLSDDFIGSSINAFVGDEKSLYGQYEEYFKPTSINNTNNFEFSTTDFAKIRFSPNVILSDVMVELPSTVVLDESDSFESNEVGIITKDDANFITEEEIINLYGGRRFFLGCTFRGQPKVFELGFIEEGKTTFTIDKEFLKVAPTYEATWQYHISHWIDKLAEDISVTNLSDLSDFGYSIMKYPTELIKEIDGIISDAYDIVHSVYPTISDYFTNIEEYSSVNDIFVTEIESIAKGLIYFNQGDPRYKELVLDVITKDTTFNSSFNNIEDEAPFTSNVDYNSRFISFRDSWLSQAENFRQLSLENRTYFVSLNDDEYVLDNANNNLSINTVTQYNDKEVRLRIWRDNNILLSNSYDSNVDYYDVDSNIKSLYEETDETVAPNEMYGVLESDKIVTVDNGSITYAIVPNVYLGDTNNRELFADIEVLSPFPEATEKVKRKIQAPLIRVNDLLSFDFDSTRTGSVFTSGADISASQNRQLDDIDFSLEEYYVGGYNRYFPNPTDTLEAVSYYNAPSVSGGPELVDSVSNLTAYLDYNDIKITPEQWIYSEIEKVGFWTAINSELLYPYALSDSFVDELLDVGKWFNVNDTKLGDFYRQVLLNIIETKNTNKITGVQSYENDPLELKNWFDGFYTGEVGPIATGGAGDITPWGTQNARYLLLEQLRNTTDKFTNHTLFFVDLSNIVTDNNLGFGSNYIDSFEYPVGLNEEFTHNPFVDSVALSGYAISGNDYNIDSLVETDGNGNVISDETDFSFIALENEFKVENKDSYTNFGNLSFTIKDVIFKVINNEDIFWGFNDTILLRDFPSGVDVNAEFEYTKEGYDTPLYHKTHLGTTTGSGEDIVPFPNKNYIAGASNVRVNRVWVDNYEVSDYNIETIDDNLMELVFNGVTINNKPNISMKYRTDKIADTTFSNSFVDNFDDKRQIKWTSMTKDKFGYSRISNNFVGFVKDEIDNKWWYRKGDMERSGDDYSYTTGGTTTGRVKVKGVKVGRDSEDVIAISNIERKNNFEFKTTLKFDDDIARSLMRTSFIFRGKFNLIDDAQYLSDYYEVALNLDDNNVALIQHYYEDRELKSNILAKISDNSSIIQRGVNYNLSFSVIKDVCKVYLNKSKEKKQFLFEYNLETGPQNDTLFDNAEEVRGSLGVVFNTPKNFNSNGLKMGMTSVTDKVYFSDIKITTFVPNNLTFGDTFISNDLDKDILNLKSSYDVKGNVSRIAKTDDNITVILIGTALFAKRGDVAGWVKMGRRVKDFRVLGSYIYVNELLSDTSSILNVYRGLFELQESILTDSDSLVGQVRDDNKVINKIKLFGDNVMLELADEHTSEEILWRDEDKQTFGEANHPWDTFEI